MNKLVLSGLIALFFAQKVVSERSYENYTKVENADNIFVGSKNFFQKIKTFHINDSDLRCTDRYLPILFLMLNSQNIEKEVDGYLNEHGKIIDHQETGHCRIFKKYHVNQNAFVIVFNSKPVLITATDVYVFLSSELYEKYFWSWIVFKLNCLDEKHEKVSYYCVIKEITFPAQIIILLILLSFSTITFCFKHYKYYLLLRDILDKKENLHLIDAIHSRKKSK